MSIYTCVVCVVLVVFYSSPRTGGTKHQNNEECGDKYTKLPNKVKIFKKLDSLYEPIEDNSCGGDTLCYSDKDLNIPQRLEVYQDDSEINIQVLEEIIHDLTSYKTKCVKIIEDLDIKTKVLGEIKENLKSYQSNCIKMVENLDTKLDYFKKQIKLFKTKLN